MTALEQSSCSKPPRLAVNFPTRFDAQIRAEIIVTFLQGFFRVVRTLETQSEMEKQVEVLLVGIGL